MNDLYKLVKRSSDCKARAGLLYTDNGIIETPVFMPVGTQGSVKAIDQKSLKTMGANLILGNTYHLYLRPGIEVFKRFKGLHKFINWDGAILTDSGGYQIFSLQDLRKLSEKGVEFKSHIDGSKHFFSPESVIEIQRFLGSDFVMVLDECTPYPCNYIEARKSTDLSLIWAKRSKQAFEKSRPLFGHRQFLFAIGQGSMFKELREDYINKILEIGFDGYAMGGLSVGEPAEIMYDIVDCSTNLLPEDKPRYLMGVGTPENLLEAIERGVDMFDCVMPTRNARNAQLFTSNGKINIKNAKFVYNDNPIDETINSYYSQNYSLGYLRHLFFAKEILALIIATNHNLAFYQWLMKTAREKILNDEYRQWKLNFLENYNKIIN